MIICPRCSSECVYVADTIHDTGTRIYRLRKCRECDTKFHTVETIIDENSPMEKEYIKARKLHNRRARGDE